MQQFKCRSIIFLFLSINLSIFACILCCISVTTIVLYNLLKCRLTVNTHTHTYLYISTYLFMKKFPDCGISRLLEQKLKNEYSNITMVKR